jgi:hypothetical protein
MNNQYYCDYLRSINNLLGGHLIELKNLKNGSVNNLFKNLDREIVNKK